MHDPCYYAEVPVKPPNCRDNILGGRSDSSMSIFAHRYLVAAAAAGDAVFRVVRRVSLEGTRASKSPPWSRVVAFASSALTD